MGQNKQSFWDSIKQKTTTTAKKTVDKMGKVVQDKANEVKDSITNQATTTGKNLIDNATESIDSVTQNPKKWMNSIQQDEEEQSQSTSMYDWSLDELYHIFIGEPMIASGGYQTVTMKTGKSFNVKIPSNRTEGSNLRLKGCGIQGADAFLILHTLGNSHFNVDRKMNSLIVQAPIYDRSKIRCLEAYNQINAAQGIDDPAALDLLDAIVSFSKLSSDLGQHYTMASQNARLLRLRQCLETALSASPLDIKDQQLLKATYQYLVAGEAVPNLQALTQLDTIILNAGLHKAFKKYYLYISTTARIMTLDLMIINGINHSPRIAPHDQSRLLSVYTDFRADKDVIDAITLNHLDEWFIQAPLPESCKAIYQLMRHHRLELTEEFEADDYQKTFQVIQSVIESIQQNKNPQSIPENQTIDVTAIPPRTLAETAYYSVSRGGLGLLSGMKIITDVDWFLEVVARVTITQVCMIEQAEKNKLGISAISPAGQSSVTGLNWQAVGSFGILGTDISQRSGIDAYQAILEEIDGITNLIENTILSRNFQEKGVLGLLKGPQKKQHILQKLETQMYS